jgi:hypothetical protein
MLFEIQLNDQTIIRIIEIIKTWQAAPCKCQVNSRQCSVRFWGEMLGHHPGKEKSEHKKTTSLIQIRRVSNNSSDRIIEELVTTPLSTSRSC